MNNSSIISAEMNMTFSAWIAWVVKWANIWILCIQGIYVIVSIVTALTVLAFLPGS